LFAFNGFYSTLSGSPPLAKRTYDAPRVIFSQPVQHKVKFKINLITPIKLNRLQTPPVLPFKF